MDERGIFMKKRNGGLFIIIAFSVIALFAVASTAAAAVKVICVPWQGNTARYHTTWDGLNVMLKGVIKTDHTGTIYCQWDFGDGNKSSVFTRSGAMKYNVEINHIYTGASGTPFTAKLLVDEVDNTMANADFDPYLVKIETFNLDAKINVAIDNGLWYLYKSGSNSSSYYHTLDGSPFMVWGYSSYYASPTASAIHAFQINGHKETGDFDEDPYAEYVQLGFNWLFNGYYYNTSYPMLRPLDIAPVHGDDPDSRPNGKGIEVRDYGYRPIYQGGMIMDAIIASGTPDADCGRDFDGDGTNETYREVVQDMIDQYAWGQYDSTTGAYGIIGGWRYNWNDWPDNSACQWAAIGMIPAQEAPWNCSVPAWVKTYNDNWLNYSHYVWNSGLWGGFGYTSPSWGDALTPSGMVQLAFVGSTTADERWVRCERWFADNWKDTGRDWLDRNNVYAYYAFAKAMRLAKPNPVVNFSAGTFAGLDWYRGDSSTMGLAEKIANQLVSSSNWNYYGTNLGTAWSVIILKPVLFAEAPVACFDADPNPSYPGATISFDPSCSTHSEPGKDIGNLVLFEWDWDNDGIYDASTTDPSVVTHAFPCASVPCVYPVTLRVTDDSEPPRTATSAMDIEITNPPHPPVADAGGPYMVSLCDGDTLTLDGSGSFDPNEGDHEAGCSTCPDDTITAWDWDLTPPLTGFDDESGETVVLDDTAIDSYLSAGTHQIGLLVTDNTALAFPGSGDPDLTDADFAEVTVYDGCACDLTAVAKVRYTNAKGLLRWTLTGAASYDIYRSTVGPNTGFVLIADDFVTTRGGYIDSGLTLDTTYWYRIVTSDGCGSKAVSVTPVSP